MEHDAEHKALSETIGELQVRLAEVEKLVAELHKEKLEREAEEEEYSDDPTEDEASTEEEEEESDDDVIPLVISVEKVKRRRKN